MFFLSLEYVGYDWMVQGLTKVLIIIAILQLVKKIPDLINSMFGTHIKPAGGIKGRLGEMAGIGAMAQKAWTSLGGVAKGIGATAAFGALGAALGGAKAGFDKVSNGSGKAADIAKKVKDTFGKVRNGQVGRVAATASAGIKSKGRGTGKAMLETWKAQPIAAFDSKRRDQIRQSKLYKESSRDLSGEDNEWEGDRGFVTYRDKDGAIQRENINRKFQKRPGADGQNEVLRKKANATGIINAANKDVNDQIIRLKTQSGMPSEVSAIFDKHKGPDGTMQPGFDKSLYKKTQAELAAKNIQSVLDGLSNAKGNTIQGSPERSMIEEASAFLMKPTSLTVENPDGTRTNRPTATIIGEYLGKLGIAQKLDADGNWTYEGDLVSAFGNSGNFAFQIGTLTKYLEGTKNITDMSRDINTLKGSVSESGNLFAQAKADEELIETYAKELDKKGRTEDAVYVREGIKTLKIKEKTIAEQEIESNFIDTFEGQTSLGWTNLQPSRPAPPAPSQQVQPAPETQTVYTTTATAPQPAPEAQPINTATATAQQSVPTADTGKSGTEVVKEKEIVKEVIKEGNGEDNSKKDAESEAQRVKDKQDIINQINRATTETKTDVDNAVKAINKNTDDRANEIRNDASKIKNQLDDIEKKNKKNDE